MTDVVHLIARGLGIDVERVTDDLEYQSIPEWDSLRHVRLLVTLERELDVRITDDLTVALHSVRAIRAFTAGITGGSLPSAVRKPAGEVAVRRGLDGVVVDRSSISHIDGERGELLHRGYRIDDLVEHSTFEDTTWLLLHGELPDPATRDTFHRELVAARRLPEPVLALLRSLAGAHPVDALRTGVSALGALESTSGTHDEPYDSAVNAGVRLVAQVPTLIAAHHAFRSGRDPVPPGDGSHAANFLHQLFGEPPTAEAERFLDQDLIIHADHSSNASAFAARVAIGARSPMHAAITSAIATFAGSLHGGAAERVMELVDAIGRPEDAAAWVAASQRDNRPVMGFGHRVYRTEDPRVRHVRRGAKALAVERGNLRGYETVEAVVAAMEPWSRHGVSPNVDLYAGLAYRLLGLPDDLAVPLFIAGRMAGWVAQALEQKRDNVLIRPLLQYVGPPARPFPHLGER